MAHMIPAHLEESKNSGEEAEKAVFDALRKLTDDYYVFHSVSDTVVTDEKKYFEKELDFVIVNQKKGILVLEVKAGSNIRYYDRKWFYSSGLEMPHGGPYKQAATGKRALRDKIQYNPNEKIRGFASKLKFFHGVFFPDMVKSQLTDLDGFAEEADLGITLFADDLISPGKRISEIFSYELPYEKYSTPQPLTDEEFDLLLRGVLCPEFHLVESPTAKRIALGESMNQLLREQYKLLEFLEEQDTAVINGAAGTGKTMIAVEKARRHSMNGEPVLFLCYNRLLRDQLAESYSGKDKKQYKNIDFMTISKLAWKVTGDYTDFQGLENRLLEYIDHPEDFPYKHIIVDEGQDFGLVDAESGMSSGKDNCSIIDTLQEVALNAGGTFYLFYDKNQMIQGGASIDYALPDCIENSDCRLTLHTNCRNTQEIAQTSYTPLRNKKKEKVKPGRTLTRSGTPVLPVMHISNDLVNSLNKTIDKLVQEKIDDIVILTQGTEDHSGIASRLDPSGDPNDGYSYYLYCGKQYKVTTCKKFKGLEADSIIMIDLGKDSFKDKKGLEFYVGTSRAKFRLDFICSLSDQDYKEIILDLAPDASTRGNSEFLREKLGGIFAAEVELD